MVVLWGLFCNETGTFLEFSLVYLLKKHLLNHNLQKNKLTKITFTNLLKNRAELITSWGFLICSFWYGCENQRKCVIVLFAIFLVWWLPKFCKIRWYFQVQSNTDVYLSFASIYINPVYMKHLIKPGLGLICVAWV